MATYAQIKSGKSSRFLDRERTVAQPGFNRWLVPPYALAIHLCIGLAYGFSVFWLPLSRVIGVANPVVCKSMTLGQALVTTSCDWRVSDLVWTYSIFSVVLDTSAAIWGGWLERAGPRKAGVVAAYCWCGGIAIGAVGVSVHQLWLLWLGTGLIGEIGLGLGYISPVSTLIKWFPDKRGMATGLAIMGFGWRRADRKPARRHADEALLERCAGRRMADLPDASRNLLRVHDVGRARLSCPPPRAGYRPAGRHPRRARRSAVSMFT